MSFDFLRMVPTLAGMYAAYTLGCTIARAAEPPQQGLIFHAPFDGTLSGTKGTPIGDFPFVPGKMGQAVRTGARGSTLLYDASSLNGAEGSVSLWVRPEWEQGAESFHMYWNLHADGQLILYKHGSGKSLVFFLRGKGIGEGQASTLATSTENWKPGEWHHVAATWGPGQAQLFLDGELKKEMTDANLRLPVITPNSVFMVGDSYHESYGVQRGMTGQPDTDFDDLRLYNRSLTPGEIRSLAGKPAVAMKIPALTRVVVPKTQTGPNIDGDFSFDEWKNAAGFSGFFDIATGRLTDKQTGVLLTYDDTNLYMAMFAQSLPGAQLQSTTTSRDGAVYTDDSIEIMLDPSAQRQAGKGVQFIANSGGSILDMKDQDMNWSGKWQYKSSINTNWLGLGLNFWVAEIAIPFTELGRNTPANGEEWAANFARNWVAGQQANTSWAWVHKQPYFTPARFGTLEFREQAPAFQWTVLRDLLTGQPTVEGSWRHQEAGTLTLTSGLNNRPLAKVELAGDTARASKWSKTVDFGGSTPEMLKVEARDGARLLYSAELPYEFESRALRTFVSPLPSKKRLLVDIDPLRYRQSWTKGWQFEVGIQDKSGKVIARQEIASYKPPFARADFDLEPIPAGEYQIAVTLRDTDRKQIASQVSPFSKPVNPIWFNNKIGITDQVLKPWTPIAVTANDLSVWGRTYAFENEMLPRQVQSQGVSMLASPIRLLIDGQSAQSVKGKAAYSEKSPARAIRNGSVQQGAWNIQWKSIAEFDGVLWYEVTLVPQKAGQKLNSLSLEMPLQASNGTLYTTGDHGMGGEAGAVPTHWTSGWKQGFWVGNEKMGLSWFTESDENWHLANPREAITFDRDEKSTSVRVNFVTQTLAVDKPITYRFGLLATPSRPMPKNWRSWQYTSRASGTTINTDPEQPTHAVSWWMNWSPLISAPFDILPGARDIPAAAKKIGAKIIPYNALQVVNDKAVDFPYFRSEWVVQPTRAAGGEAGTDQQSWFVSVNSSYRDYMLYALRQSVRDVGWDGHYFDFDGGALADTNEFHGSGYINASGERRPTYDLLAQRNFHKRLWAMLQEELKTEEPVVLVHNSASVAPYAHTFTNSWLDGEQFNFSPKVNDDYTKVVSRDTFRAEFLGSQFGSVVVMLPALGHLHTQWLQAPAGPEKEATRQRFQKAIDTLILYPFVHGTLLYPAWLDMEYLRPLYEARRSLDIGTARFYGYWDNSNLVKLTQNGNAANPDVVASIYAQDNRFWLVTGNWTGEPQEVTATLDLAKIAPKLPTDAKLTSLWKGETASVQGNQVRMTVPPKAMTIVELQ